MRYLLKQLLLLVFLLIPIILLGMYKLGAWYVLSAFGEAILLLIASFGCLFLGLWITGTDKDA